MRDRAPQLSARAAWPEEQPPVGYGVQLREKQKLRRIYGLLERQFRNMYYRRPEKRHHRREPAAGAALLETKFYVPRLRRGVVARPRLSERLRRGTESKLTLISAPAGFGKTTLLAEWLAAVPAVPRSVAWLSLDQADNHPASFWTYVIRALQTAVPGIGASAALTAAGSPATADRDDPRAAPERARRGHG